MVPCDNEYISQIPKKYWYLGNFYCPDWKDSHKLQNTWHHKVHTYGALEVHRCDPERRAKLNKTCASDEEVDNFLNSNTFVVQGLSQTALMDQYTSDLSKSTRKTAYDILYTT